MLSSLITRLDERAFVAWDAYGFDADRDLFHERLAFDGSPLAVPYRAMVQARQIYVFSHAALLGLAPDGAEKAARAMRQLVRSFATSSADETSFAFSIDPRTGDQRSTVRDSYTHAFVLLATAFLYRATYDPSLVSLAEEVARFIDRRLMDPVAGGVIDALPQPVGAGKRQNPQMHLLEAYLALEEAMPGHGYLEKALPLVKLFTDRMFGREAGVLLEYFAPDWGPHPDAARARIFEPGHHYEWVWLLAETERLAGLDLSAERAALWRSAQDHGHAANGLIYDEVTADRQVASASHRLWPLTEAIKAATVEHRRGNPDARAFADDMAGLLMKHFLSAPFEGGWIDHLNADLTPRVDYVPASSLYHLFLAAAEARKAFALDPA